MGLLNLTHGCSFPHLLQPKVKLLINGKFVDSQTSEWIDLRNPVRINIELAFVQIPYSALQATNEVIAKVPQSTQAEMNQAADAAQTAFKAWRNTPVTARVRKIFEYRDRIVQNLVRCSFAPCGFLLF